MFSRLLLARKLQGVQSTVVGIYDAMIAFKGQTTTVAILEASALLSLASALETCIM
jgi:hypothetical protein